MPLHRTRMRTCLGNSMCIYTIGRRRSLVYACSYCPFNFIATSAKSVIIVDHRSFPRVVTTLSWAERHAGRVFASAARPFSVISSATCPPRPAPFARTMPSRCKGRRFRNRVVRSIPSHSLNSAMPHPFLACNARSIGVCVGRIPCRLTSASKNCVMTRDTRRILKHVQFSTEVISSCFVMQCIYTLTVRLSIGERDRRNLPEF